MIVVGLAGSISSIRVVLNYRRIVLRCGLCRCWVALEGQTIAGAINTGTHGGDAARPPLSDAVCAIVMVTSGGVVKLIEPSKNECVNETTLAKRLGVRVETHRDSGLFDAALVSLGRLGMIWAYVIEVHDETKVAVVETRTVSRWDVVRHTIVSDAVAAAGADEFLQFVIEPIAGAPYKTYVTRHRSVTGDATDENEEPRLVHVQRARELTGCAFAFGKLLAMGQIVEILPRLLLELPILLSPEVQARIAARGFLGSQREAGRDALRRR